MIQKLILKNFRNFSDFTLSDLEVKNFIIGSNGKGKTNILEALALLGNTSILHLSFEDLVKTGEEYFFIEIFFDSGEKHSLFYDKATKKKQYSIQGKKITRKKFLDLHTTYVLFSPMIMNMLYLSPSLRRDFLDHILQSCFPEFENIKKSYTQVLKSRNATLKAIREKQAEKHEVYIWNEKCVELAELYYKKRFILIDFFSQHIKKIEKFLNIDCQSINFFYQTKVRKESIAQDMKTYFLENEERDIILGTTHIGPHIDDFYIQVNNNDITHNASRGEIKSIVIYLKLLEGIFIENITKRKPILLIDDLLSELDLEHKNTLLDSISYYQTFISNIESHEEQGKKIILQ